MLRKNKNYIEQIVMTEKLRNTKLDTHDRPTGIFVVKQDLILCRGLALRKNCLSPPFRWASFFSGKKIKSLVLQKIHVSLDFFFVTFFCVKAKESKYRN